MARKEKLKSSKTLISKVKTATPDDSSTVIKSGPAREYLRTSPLSSDENKLSKSERLHLLILTFAAMLTRLINIDIPSSSVFDEVHLGSQINRYLGGEYFIDINPPFVKLLYTFVASIFGYKGDFEFEPLGKSYLVNKTSRMLVPYVALRSVSAFCSVALVLLTYKILRLSGVRHFISLFGAFLITFENSLITQSRLFLLDGPLLFFTALSIALIKTSDSSKAFGLRWWSSLIISAVALGCTISSKWSGFFTFIWIFYLTSRRVWLMVGDLDLTNRFVARYSLSKLFVLLVVPFAVYLATFAAHTKLLNSFGPGYYLMPPAYQQTLENNHLQNITTDVSFGSTVTFRHQHTGKYLHSHNATYPKSGSKQVTGYDYPDENNLFFIEQRIKSNVGDLLRRTKEIESGRQIRLFHNVSNSYLWINPDQKPPVSETDYNHEVSRIGNGTWLGDNFLNFEIRISTQHTKTELGKKRLRALDSAFQIYNIKNKCYLLATENVLPDWGFGQNEVICIEKPIYERSLWYIESNTHEKFLPDLPQVQSKDMSIFEKIIQVHLSMFKYAKTLSNEHSFKSFPSQWIFLNRGVNYWSQENATVYYLGNFVVYCLTGVAILSFLTFKIGQVITFNPNKSPNYTKEFVKFDNNGLDFLVGYLLNFVPLMFTDKLLFIHDYLPSLFFAILLVCQLFEYVASKNKRNTYPVMIVLAIMVFLTFNKYKALIYGMEWTKKECHESRIRPTWDIYCDIYKH